MTNSIISAMGTGRQETLKQKGCRRRACARFLRCSSFFYNAQGLGEGRENRPQLRCGNVSQTSNRTVERVKKPVG
jgi:hypothetical protein